MLFLPSFYFSLNRNSSRSELGIVHKDRACRNVLVGENKVLKISNFGLARENDILEWLKMRMSISRPCTHGWETLHVFAEWPLSLWIECCDSDV